MKRKATEEAEKADYQPPPKRQKINMIRNESKFDVSVTLNDQPFMNNDSNESDAPMHVPKDRPSRKPDTETGRMNSHQDEYDDGEKQESLGVSNERLAGIEMLTSCVTQMVEQFSVTVETSQYSLVELQHENKRLKQENRSMKRLQKENEELHEVTKELREQIAMLTQRISVLHPKMMYLEDELGKFKRAQQLSMNTAHRDYCMEQHPYFDLYEAPHEEAYYA